MNNESLFGDRLKQERKRLGLSQDAAAELGGVSREMWGKYERGGAQPGGDVFTAVAHHGFDVAFLLTGLSATDAPPDSLSKRERAMLTAYKALSDELRGAVDLLIGVASERTNGVPPKARQAQAGVSQVIKGQVGQVIRGKKFMSTGAVTIGVPLKREPKT